MEVKSQCSFSASKSPTEVPLIVLTGGPGAGKTAVLELARKHFCANIAFLPEAASIIFSGGFWRRESVTARKAAQRAIFHVQRESERLAQEEKAFAALLCDRGTMDGLAYWPESSESFWAELGTSKEQEMRRYSVVIHLHTPSEGYNLSNPMRIETVKQAMEIDERIARVWDGHPRRVFVANRGDFLEKAADALARIREVLPACCRVHDLGSIAR